MIDEEQIKSALFKLKDQLNSRVDLKKEYLDSLVDVLKKRTPNERYIFFKEAPLFYKTFPKAKNIQEFFVKRPIKPKSQPTKTYSYCHKCGNSGMFVGTNPAKSTMAIACDCSLGQDVLKMSPKGTVLSQAEAKMYNFKYAIREHRYKKTPWHNKWTAIAAAADRDDEKALSGAKFLIKGLTDDDIMALLNAYRTENWEFATDTINKFSNDSL